MSFHFFLIFPKQSGRLPHDKRPIEEPGYFAECWDREFSCVIFRLVHWGADGIGVSGIVLPSGELTSLSGNLR
jgi:hypothetical protein